jgi:hypothetical protein
MAPLSLRRAALAVLCVWASGCADGNPGAEPPRGELFFPSGLLLDPRQEPGLPAKYLFVANGNNDLSYNTGTLVAIDLEAFFDEWSQTNALGEHTFAVEPYCTDTACVRDIGSPVELDEPCRRLALLPQVVECDETPFIRAAHRVGDFATLLTHSCEGFDGARCDEPRLWLPQRGDPSILYMDIGGDPDEVPELDCASGAPSDVNPFAEDQDVERREWDARPGCGGSHRLTHYRNDENLEELPREPFNMIVSPTKRIAYVAHSDGVGLTLIDLDGINDGSGPATRRPAIIDIATVFLDPSGTTGGFGLAERPCNTESSPPSITLGCERPLVYAGFRYSRLLASFTVQGVELEDDEVAPPVRDDGGDDDGAGPGAVPPQCAGPEEIGDIGKIDCDEKVRSTQLIFPGGLDPSSTGFRPILGDVAFTDETGDELLVLQTGPGALLKLDTHVGPDGEPVDTPSAPPLELCDEPTRMHLYEDGGQRYALVTCYRAALIYVVDLQAFRVLDSIVLGTGPYELEIDEPRKLLYVANNLEGSITVIDLSRERKTRFREIARIGLQEPFSR